MKTLTIKATLKPPKCVLRNKTSRAIQQVNENRLLVWCNELVCKFKMLKTEAFPQHLQ